jgi:hypothetical protein
VLLGRAPALATAEKRERLDWLLRALGGSSAELPSTAAWPEEEEKEALLLCRLPCRLHSRAQAESLREPAGARLEPPAEGRGRG